MMEFYDYLISLGFNEIGAREVVERIENNLSDREDIALFERYKEGPGRSGAPGRGSRIREQAG